MYDCNTREVHASTNVGIYTMLVNNRYKDK